MKDLSEKNLNSLQVSNVQIRIILILLGLTLIGYWPVASGLFALKNDAINYFLPYRYSIVESLRAGHLPYWSPYVYMGYPINGDIQSGAYNPIVWILSVFGSYTLRTLHIETIIYLFLGSLGLYKLLIEFKTKQSVSLVISATYLFCGFFTDNGQNISWLANAAFLPFSYVYFYRLLTRNNWKNSLKLALAMSMLFVAGYPFFFICTCYLFLLISIIWIVYQLATRSNGSIKVFFRQILIAAIVTFLLCAAPLYHFIYMIPFYERGDAISLEYALTNSLPPKSLISFLFPWSVSKSKELLETDMSHLNSYIGILTIPFILPGVFNIKKKFRIPLLLILLVTVSLSLGKWGMMRSWTFEFLPLMNRFRHPANFRIFSIQILLIFAAFGLSALIEKYEDRTLQKLLRGGFISLGILITILVVVFWPQNFDFTRKLMDDTSRQALKDLNVLIDFRASVFITGLIQILFLAAGYFILTRNNFRNYFLLLLMNVLFVAQLTVFTTFVSKSPINEIEKYIRYEKKFPLPGTDQIIQSDTMKTFGYPPGLKYVFLKKIVIQEDFTNPSYLKSYADFTNDRPMKRILSHYPVVYLADKVVGEASISNLGIGDSLHLAFIENPLSKSSPVVALQKKLISIVQFGPNRFEFEVESDKSTYLCLFQNNYPYWRAFVDNNETQILTANHSFMSIPITEGKHHIVFEIRNSKSTASYLISFLSLLGCGTLLVVRQKTKVSAKR